MKKSIYLLLLLMAFMSLIFSCNKGTSVEPSPVYYSDWITPSCYTRDTLNGVLYYDANIAAPRITDSILNSGTILVYAKLDGYNPSIWPTDQVSIMPVSIFYQLPSGNGGMFQFNDLWSARATVGNIDIHVEHSDYTLPNSPPGHQFRYVIIPGNNHILSTVNTKNYSEVKAVLHIKK